MGDMTNKVISLILWTLVLLAVFAMAATAGWW
jgi:hypothetical protein